MKDFRPITILLLLALVTYYGNSQDVRTVDTRVADLLARFPSKNAETTEKLMNDMLSLGDAGIKQICSQIKAFGTGDDTKARFAVESYSQYILKDGMEKEKTDWEKICIGFVKDQNDYTVKDFFMKQLQIVGGDASIDAVRDYLTDANLCSPAVAVITAAGGKMAEQVLSASLKNRELPCPATVMNSLAGIRSSLATDEFIYWSGFYDKAVKAAAFNALALTGDPKAYSILSKAARQSYYTWEQTGATEALLNFAIASGEKGDIKTMDNICKTVTANCNDRKNMQYKIKALDIMVKYKGYEALAYLTSALDHSDKSYRTAASRLFMTLPEQTVTIRLIDFFIQAKPVAKPEIIRLLGDRKDELAVPLVTASLSDPDQEIRVEAAIALVKLRGTDAIPSLIEYMVRSTSAADQDAAKSALMKVLNSSNIHLLTLRLSDSGNPGKKSIIELLAWTKSRKYFSEVIPYTTFEDEQVKGAAFRALADLSSYSDLDILAGLLDKNENPSYTGDIQSALAAAVRQLPEAEARATGLIKAMHSMQKKEKMIPVLAMTGGSEALATVLREFENGSVEMRSTCFKALALWNDYTVTSALYEICASKNKTYEGPAFESYVRQVRTAPVMDELKLQLYRKIMPFAIDASRKNLVIAELGKIKLYQSLFFTAGFLDNQETGAEAAHSAMVIALPSVDSKSGMTGSLVRTILNKAISRLSGPEADYNKELIGKYIASLPDDEGFVPVFNGNDLAGWQGLVDDPLKREKMKPAELEKKQAEANKKMVENWSVSDGCIYSDGKGDNLCSVKEYNDFELLVDWKIIRKGEGGNYPGDSPQVQIWDAPGVEAGAKAVSGGLNNNETDQGKPPVVAANAVNEWNTSRIILTGEKVSAWLNGKLVTDDVVMEDYRDNYAPVFPGGAIELQTYGNEIEFRDIYIREINEKEFNLTSVEKKEGFISLFNGRNLDNWIGDKKYWLVDNGLLVIKPDTGSGGNLFTEKEYADFVFRFEFQLTPAANNGLGIRAPLEGDAAYLGMEIQILDDTAPVYANLQPYQYNGSVYGVFPSKQGFQQPLGDWNFEEVYINGTRIRVTLNGTVIVDGDIADPAVKGTIDHNQHPGLKNQKGHIGFLGHGSEVRFRNIRIKELTK
jgi:HEAT repeat protein